MFKKYFYEGKETNYSISDKGEIRNDKTGKMLKGTYLSCEYQKVNLVIEGKEKCFMVHRLVAQTFLPNPNNFPVVHHKDNNFFNNCVENLEWQSSPGEQKNKGNNIKIINFEDATWVPLSDYPKYGVCREGFVCNLNTKQVLKGSERNGYKRIQIGGKTHSVHILIYNTFIGEIPAGYVIDHINGKRDDNRIENLRCITQSENMKNAQLNGHKGQQKVRQYDLNHNFIKDYPNLSSAAKEFGVTYRAIASAAERGGTSCGYYWEKI